MAEIRGGNVDESSKRYVGRGAQIRPANRFHPLRLDVEDEADTETPSPSVESRSPPQIRVKTQLYPDDSQSIVSENKSPDIHFRYSVNPYRGCAHGCSYCYARPTHEYLGFDAGLDFESKILVKHDAPELLRRWLSRPAWQPEPIMFSGVTDCYQPSEVDLRLTRRCLEICAAAGQPVSIVTKNALVTRDLDVLAPMAERNLVHVAISVTSLDQSLTRVMEPRTSSPQARLDAIHQLNEAGISTQVMVAPVIPALNEHEIARILGAAAKAGASTASYVILRLPLTVEPIFTDWLRRHFPHRAAVVLNRIRAIRGGDLNASQFGVRMRGEGIFAQQIEQTFRIFSDRYELSGKLPELNVKDFQPPSGQRRLF